jgi:hypothetical protein
MKKLLFSLLFITSVYAAELPEERRMHHVSTANIVYYFNAKHPGKWTASFNPSIFNDFFRGPVIMVENLVTTARLGFVEITEGQRTEDVIRLLADTFGIRAKAGLRLNIGEVTQGDEIHFEEASSLRLWYEGWDR